MALVGAVILTIVENGLIMVGASPFIFDIVRAAVLILAVVAEALQRREARALLLRRQRVQEVARV
jgi:ribose/xylose/arabinose/galactoside ABC-type transport system permease subunit